MIKIEPINDVQVKVIKRGGKYGNGKHSDYQHRKG